MRQLKLFFTLCIFAFVAVACSNSSDSPEAATKEFVKVFFEGKGDSDKLLDIIYVPDSDKMDPQEKSMVMGKLAMFTQMAKEDTDAKGGVKEVKIDNVTYNEDKTQASVTMTVVYGNGETNDGKGSALDLIKQDGKWKVNLK